MFFPYSNKYFLKKMYFKSIFLPIQNWKPKNCEYIQSWIAIQKLNICRILFYQKFPLSEWVLPNNRFFIINVHNFFNCQKKLRRWIFGFCDPEDIMKKLIINTPQKKELYLMLCSNIIYKCAPADQIWFHHQNLYFES